MKQDQQQNKHSTMLQVSKCVRYKKDGPRSTVGFKESVVACSGSPYTCCIPGKARSKEIPSGPLGFKSVWPLNVSSHHPSGSPSCRGTVNRVVRIL